MWSVEFVQVPEEAKCKACTEGTKENKGKEDVTDSLAPLSATTTTTTTTSTTTETKTSTIPSTQDTTASSNITSSGSITKPTDMPRLGRRESCDSYIVDAKAVADRLKEFKDPDYLATKEIELGSSAESESYFSRRLAACKDEMSGIGPPDKRNESNLSSTSSASDIYKTSDTASVEDDLDTAASNELLIFEECPRLSAVDNGSVKSVDAAVDALLEFEQEQQRIRKTPDSTDSIRDDLSSKSNFSDQQNTAADMDESTDTIKADDQTDSLDKTEHDSDKDSAKSSSSDFVVISSSDVPSFNKLNENQNRKPKLSMKNHLREGKCCLQIQGSSST